MEINPGDPSPLPFCLFGAVMMRNQIAISDWHNDWPLTSTPIHGIWYLVRNQCYVVTSPGHQTRGPCHKGFMSPWFKTCKNTFCNYTKSNDRTRSLLCTCHDSWGHEYDCDVIGPSASITGWWEIILIFQLWAQKFFVKSVSDILRQSSWRPPHMPQPPQLFNAVHVSQQWSAVFLGSTV